MNRATIGYGLMVVAVVAAVVYLMPSRPLNDVERCRAIFAGLARGRGSVQEQIDWMHLQALGQDLGAAYQVMKTDADRTRYRQTFVVGFSQGFQGTGARLSEFVNWREYARQGATVTIATDYPKHQKTLLMVLGTSSDGKQRLQDIRWKDAT